MPKRGKNFQVAVKAIEENKEYELEEAVILLKEISKVNFDATVELHMRTNADPRHADQLIRGVAALPKGLGKPIAKNSGADFIGDENLIKEIEGGWVDFEVGLAVPDMMSKIGRLGRVLGRRGLMPNPRTGTMVQPQDLPRAIEDAKRGRLEYRLDRTAIIHSPVGKISFPVPDLIENIASLMDAVVKSKPSGIKGSFIKTAFLASTMSPSIRLNVSSLLSVKVE